jgi:hypothetical protein
MSNYNYNQNQNQNVMQPSIDHIMTEPPNFLTNPPPKQMPELYGSQHEAVANRTEDNYLPVEPIHLNPTEEQALTTDVARELVNYSSTQLKNFYTDLTTYDPSLSGYIHYHYIAMVALKNNVIENKLFYQVFDDDCEITCNSSRLF